MKKIKSSTEGITLVALVVTLVVLLMLAGITLVYVFGDNGVFQKATDSKTQTEIAIIKERVQADILGLQATNQSAKISKSEFKIILDEYFTDVPDDYTIETEITAKEEYGNHTVKVSDLYGGSFAPNSGISSSDIAKAEDKSEYYGAIVNGYECPNSAGINNWKLFYANENNIYLIADDYIHSSYCPPSANYRITKYSSGYWLSMNNVINDYVGSASITDIKIQKLNKSYFDYLKANSQTSTNNNMKAVAYMSDTNVWKVYAGAKAEYAIGGPTLEMLFASYNQKHGTNYQARAKNINGYELSADGGTTWEVSMSKCFEDNLYVIKETTKATNMWVSSPATTDANNPVAVSWAGDVWSSIYNYPCYAASSLGFRPLVCLNSDVRLEKNEDGTFKLK